MQAMPQAMPQPSLLSLLGQSRLLGQNAVPGFPQMTGFGHLQQMMSQQQAAVVAQQQQQSAAVPQVAQEDGSNNNNGSKGLVSDKPYVCDICGRGYSYLASLQQHQACHRADHQHQCQGCGRLFKSKDELEKHKETHNTDGNETRPHQCETCGRRFTLLENLHRHQMIHTDERPFACHYCHKRFRLAQHLKEHIRIHTGEKPYKCNVCGRAFCQISNLKSHQKTHTKVKAFECDICHKTFRRSFTLKQHKLIHEREKKSQTQQVLNQINGVSAPAGSIIGSEVASHLDEATSVIKPQPVTLEGELCTVEDIEVDVDVEALENEPSSPSTGSSDMDFQSENHHNMHAGDNQLRQKDTSSPGLTSTSDSGHGSPTRDRKLGGSDHSEEESATNSGSDDSGAITQNKTLIKFYRPFEVEPNLKRGRSAESGSNDESVDSYKGGIATTWEQAVKRRMTEAPVDITQTKRVLDQNGKVVIYPGVRDGDAINRVTSTLDEMRNAASGQSHWDSLRPDQEYLWRRLGRGQDNTSNNAQTAHEPQPEMVPVVEWRPVVVGYRSLKDGSVTSREDIQQQVTDARALHASSAAAGLLKGHPLLPLPFPQINSQ